MPTPKRKWYPGATYHITARGNRRNDIFKEEEDFQYYLKLIEEALHHYLHHNYKVICYCLMDNHVHLLIKTEDQPIGIFIGRINSKYAKYYNKKYNYIGHLFQDRFHSELIEKDTQMLVTSRYIHLNPVRAKMVSSPIEYRWSSYNVYLNEHKRNIIDKGYILFYFNGKDRELLYKLFVEEIEV